MTGAFLSAFAHSVIKTMATRFILLALHLTTVTSTQIHPTDTNNRYKPQISTTDTNN